MATVETAPGKHKALQYQGRKTSRVKSEQRRRDILEAALRIVVREGVRGIRHRAVAREAQVPLAATTYYFKDIDELIVDTFTLYTEKALGVVTEFTRQFYQPLAASGGHDLRSAEGQALLSSYLVEQLTGYLCDQVVAQRDMRIVEQAFRYEAIVNPNIRTLARIHRQALFDKAVEFFTTVASSGQPQADAEILIALFHSLEYGALLADGDHPDLSFIRVTLQHYLALLLPSLLKA